METATNLLSDSESLHIEIQSLKSIVEQNAQRIALYDEEVSHLYEIIRKMKREAYGPRRERWESEEQVLLFNEAESYAADAVPAESEVGVSKKAFHR